MNNIDDASNKMQNLNINQNTSPNRLSDRERNISATGGGGFSVISQASQPQHHGAGGGSKPGQSPHTGQNGLQLP